MGKQRKDDELAKRLLNFSISAIKIVELSGFAPIGMMEHWNNGFWGIDGMGYWEVDKA